MVFSDQHTLKVDCRALASFATLRKINPGHAIAVPISTGLGIPPIRLLEALARIAGRFAMPTRTHHHESRRVTFGPGTQMGRALKGIPPACHLRVLRGVALGRICPRLGGHARKDVTPEK